jgi:hypothetical protein
VVKEENTMYDYTRINENTMRGIFEGAPDPIEPREALVVHVFVMGDRFESEASQLTYQAMDDADESDRHRIASDAVVAYCEARGIAWGTVRVLNIRHYDHGRMGDGHFVIEGLVGKREEATR